MLIIKGGHVLSGGGAPEQPHADVVVEGGVITAVSTVDNVPDGAEVIDATGLVVLPGLVDSHRHVAQAPLRGVGADMTLPDYLVQIIGRALPAYSPDDARLATLLGAAEALDAGITTVHDWSNAINSPDHLDAVVDGFTTSGIRAVIGHPFAGDAHQARHLAELSGRVTGGLAILGPEHGPWDEAVRLIALGRDHGLLVSSHVSGGVGASVRLKEAGLLGPHLHLIHANAMTEDEARLLATAGVGVTVTPIVEAVMGFGWSAYGTFRDGGGRAGLGTDVVVNAPPDLFDAMRDTLRHERHRAGRLLPAADVLPAATVDSARAIGLADSVGTLAVGHRADIVLLTGLAHLAGSAPVAGAVVTSLTPANVDTVVVDGRIAKRGGRLLDLDLAALRGAATEVARRVLDQRQSGR